MVSIAVWIFAFAPFPELTECDYDVLSKGKRLLGGGIITL
jgi:hypothetical protein